MVKEHNLKKKLLLLALCFFLFVAVANAGVRASNFAVYVPNAGSIGFQNTPDIYVLLTVTSGFINSTVNQLRLSRGQGYFQWTALNDSTVQVTFDVDNGQVSASGDSGTADRKILSGTTLTVLIGNVVRVEWNYHPDIWLPIMFIFGMIGILSTFGGSLYTVNAFKNKHYHKGFYYGVLFIPLGLGLVLAWLWGAG